MPRDPKAPRMSGVDVCDLAADAIGESRGLIYRCINAYIKYALEVLTRGGGALVLPCVGTLRVKKMQGRNRYNVATKKVARAPAAKGIKVDMSAQIDDLLNPKKTGKRRHARGVSEDALVAVSARIRVEVETIRDVLRKWGDAAVVVLVGRGRVVIADFGTLKVVKWEARARHDAKSAKLRIRPERYSVAFRPKPAVKQLFR